MEGGWLFCRIQHILCMSPLWAGLPTTLVSIHFLNFHWTLHISSTLVPSIGVVFKKKTSSILLPMDIEMHVQLL
jgi:hypothetical protein